MKTCCCQRKASQNQRRAFNSQVKHKAVRKKHQKGNRQSQTEAERQIAKWKDRQTDEELGMIVFTTPYYVGC